MKTDKELLELAAKVAGYNIKAHEDGTLYSDCRCTGYWGEVMKLEIKMRDGRYIAKICEYGCISSMVRIYEIKPFKFLCFTFKSKVLIGERIVHMTVRELFSRGVKDMTDEINYSISKYESARQGWEKLGVKL